MAKVLTEQPRLWGPSGEDPRQFGDGAPLHSAEPFDMTRTLNNRMTYGDPAFQFVYDSSLVTLVDTSAKQRIRYRI